MAVGPPAPVRHRHPARHPRPGARGVPHRPRRLGGDHVPHAAGLGRGLRRRPRGPGRRGDRRHDARSRHPPGPGAGARRRAGPAVGTGRGVHLGGPVPGRDDRHLLRARAAAGRRPRDPQALRGLLGLAVGSQLRTGARGSARAARRVHGAVRDGAARRRGPVGDARLHRGRRSPRGGRPAPAHRRAARRVGLRRHRRRRLLRRRLPAPPARRRDRPRRRGRPGAGRRHRRRAAHGRGLPRPARPGRARGRRRRGARRPRGATRAAAEGGARAARRDASRGHRRPRPTSTVPSTAPSRAGSPRSPSSCSPTTAPCPSPAPRGSP